MAVNVPSAMPNRCLAVRSTGAGSSARMRWSGRQAGVGLMGAGVSALRAGKEQRVAGGVRRNVAVVSAEQASGLAAMDKAREETRKTRRVVFTPERWIRHRSADRYLRHLTTLPLSSISQDLSPSVFFLASIAGFVCAYNEFGVTMYDNLPALTLPGSALGPSTGALSLLLVFRTNSSYGRWWEARKIWGGLLNRSRDFVRQGLSWFKEEDVASKEQLVRYTIAFAVALKVHLRSDEDMRTELTGVLNEAELEAALAEVHVPNHILRVISEVVWQADISPILTTEISQNITFFEDVLGKCERILKTPIPLQYTRHTSRFLFLWLAILPFTLYDSCHWLSIPIEAFTAFFLMGIDDIGVQIEEPFSVLSCEAICGSITSNCSDLLNKDARDRALIAPRNS